MKYFLLSGILLSLLACDKTPKVNERDVKASTTTENGLLNSSGVTTQEMNPSPNPAPTTEAEVIENTTLTNKKPVESGPYGDGKNIPGKNEIQAEEDAMDYSTTPEEKPSEDEAELRPSIEPNPNKIGN